jgi:hypothetical protein
MAVEPLRPFEVGFNASEHREMLSKIATALPALGAATPETVHAAEAKIALVERKIETLLAEQRRFAEQQFGALPPVPVERSNALASLGAQDAAALAEVAAFDPAIASSLNLLASARPEVFAEVDSITHQRFSDQLRDFTREHLTRADVRGFAEFLKRVALRQFDWRRGGYSHTVTSAMNTVFNHPGLILELIAASRENRTIPVKSVFEHDGATGLRPTGDLKAGFQPVESVDTLPAAELGYERGFLRALRDELSPKWTPPNRFGGTCDPIAVALSKLTGQSLRYGYAWNIRTGADLVEALATQNGEGLAFGEVGVTYAGKTKSIHFPVFYDFDPKTRTVAMQEWTRSERRLKVDELSFATKGEARPAIYYRETDAINRFLTPENQNNWNNFKKGAE